MSKKVLILSDLHFPYVHKQALDKVYKQIQIEKFDVIISIGDLLDQYVFSKYTINPKITPEEDVTKGLKMAREMWKKIHQLQPKAQLYQLLGNHDQRLSKRISEKLPQLHEVFNTKSLYKFDNVKTLNSERDYLKIDGVVYVHGWLSKSLDHTKHFGLPVVHGHRHRSEISTEGRLWSMDVGFLGDEKRMPFNYTMSAVTKWTVSWGVVENGRPRLYFLK